MGLFGIVSGSKIKNIVCENIMVETYAWDGNVNREKINMDSAAIIVGRAVAPANSTKDYNVIENCVVLSTCSVTGLSNRHPDTALQSSPLDQSTVLGGVVARAQGTTVRNCVNEATITNKGSQTMSIGGIVGLIEGNGLVEWCVNKGNIVLNLQENSTESAFERHANGGIVGFLGSTTGIVDINDCCNSGDLIINGTLNVTPSWGGILSLSKGLTEQVSIRRCYNFSVCSSINSNQNEGGILGNASRSDTTVKVYDCYSVAVRDDTTITVGTWLQTHIVFGLRVGHATNGDGAQVYFTDNSGAIKEVTTTTDANLAPLSSAVVAEKAEKMEQAVEKAQAEACGSIYIYGIQQAIGENDYRTRVIGFIKGLDNISEIGFEANWNGKYASAKANKVYTSFLGVNGDVADYEFTNQSLKTDYFAMYTFNPVLNGQSMTGMIKGRYYVITESGNKIYSLNTVNLRFVDGKLQNTEFTMDGTEIDEITVAVDPKDNAGYVDVAKVFSDELSYASGISVNFATTYASNSSLNILITSREQAAEYLPDGVTVGDMQYVIVKHGKNMVIAAYDELGAEIAFQTILEAVKSSATDSVDMSALCSDTPVSYTYGGNNSLALSGDAEYRIMQYNVMYGAIYEDSAANTELLTYSFDQRVQFALNAVKYYSPDVIGFEEFDKYWHESFIDNLIATGYTVLGNDVEGVSADSGTPVNSIFPYGVNYTPIAFKTDKFRCLASGWEMLIDPSNPNQHGRGYTGYNVTWAVLEDKDTAKIFGVTASHNLANTAQEAVSTRTDAITRLKNIVNANIVEEYGCPVFCVGDFNTIDRWGDYKAMVNSETLDFDDSRYVAERGYS